MSYKAELQSNNADLQQILDAVNALPEAGSGVSEAAVLYTPQTLTDDQQAQARENIGIEGTGKDGESITVVDVISSSEDGGENIVCFSDGSTLIVTNGNTGARGLTGPVGPSGPAGANGTPGNGIKSALLNADYTLTLTFDDGTSYTTPSIRGETGDKGEAGEDGVHILEDDETLDDAPPAAAVVIDPNGAGFESQTWTFTLTDGSVVNMEVFARVV